MGLLQKRIDKMKVHQDYVATGEVEFAPFAGEVPKVRTFTSNLCALKSEVLDVVEEMRKEFPINLTEGILFSENIDELKKWYKKWLK